jgi:hypothetical protein
VNIRRIIVFLAALLLAAFAVQSSAAGTAKAATIAPARQATAMGVTSSGQIINLEKPPSWLKPNTLVRPLDPVSPDQLRYGGYYACFSAIACLNNWDGGGQGNLIRWYHYSTTLNPHQQWNWWYEGTVAPQLNPPWPFTPGSGINNTYDGNAVYKFAYAPNDQGSGNCISQQLFGSGDTGSNLNLTSCACSTCQTQTGSKYQYFVLDGNGRLVAVEATNLYAAFYGNSGRVWVGVGSDMSYADGKYAYLVSNISYSKLVFRPYL